MSHDPNFVLSGKERKVESLPVQPNLKPEVTVPCCWWWHLLYSVENQSTKIRAAQTTDDAENHFPSLAFGSDLAPQHIGYSCTVHVI